MTSNYAKFELHMYNIRDRSVFMTRGGAGDLDFSTAKIWKPPLKFLSKNEYPTLNFLSKNGNPPLKVCVIYGHPPHPGIVQPFRKIEHIQWLLVLNMDIMSIHSEV